MPKMKNDGKPPLAKSPIRLRPRRVVRSTQTPPGYLMRPQKAAIRWDEGEESKIRPEYWSISCELRALARMVREEVGSGAEGEGGGVRADSPAVFERGRCYEEYSARRNERLAKRKKGGESGTYSHSRSRSRSLGVTVESCKRRLDGPGKRTSESLRKTVEGERDWIHWNSTCSLAPAPTPRYLLRSMTVSKEKKAPPPLALGVGVKSAVAGGSERKAGAWTATRSRRI